MDGMQIELLFVISILFGVITLVGVVFSWFILRYLRKKSRNGSVFLDEEKQLIKNNLQHGQNYKEEISDDSYDSDDSYTYEADIRDSCKITLYEGGVERPFVRQGSFIKIVGSIYPNGKMDHCTYRLENEYAGELVLIEFSTERNGYVSNINQEMPVHVNFEKLTQEEGKRSLRSNSIIRINDSVIKVLFE